MDRKQGRWKRVLFLDDNTGYRLLVADAAAGSRFYELEMTKDGGQSWNQKMQIRLMEILVWQKE